MSPDLRGYQVGLKTNDRPATVNCFHRLIIIIVIIMFFDTSWHTTDLNNETNRELDIYRQEVYLLSKSRQQLELLAATHHRSTIGQLLQEAARLL